MRTQEEEDVVAGKHFRRLAEVLHAKFDVQINIISSIGIFYACDDKLALFFIDKYLCNHNYRCDSPWLNTTTSSDVTWEMPLSPPIGYWLRPQNIQTSEFVTNEQVITIEQLAHDVDDAIDNFNQIDEDEIRIARNGGWSLMDDVSELDLVARSVAGHDKLKSLGYEFKPKQCVMIDTNAYDTYNKLLWRDARAMTLIKTFRDIREHLVNSTSREELELKCATAGIELPTFDFTVWCALWTIDDTHGNITSLAMNAVCLNMFDELFTSAFFIEDAIKFFTDEKGQVMSQALYYTVGVREKRLASLKTRV